MNEIVRIHIAGVPYEIDVDARKKLNKYLDDIKDSLDDAKDALDDIEIRITEILGLRGIHKNDVIRASDVAAIKEQLGEPKDFSSDQGKHKKSEDNIADKIRAGFADKKYFRDRENGIVGGVLAGFSAYTGWDVTLLRILFVVLLIFTAFFPLLILYIVVWICAPEARTATDRLSMKGEPINLETIKESAKDLAGKAEKTARATGEKIKEAAPATKNLAARIILGFFGVIGLLSFVPCLIALIPATIFAIIHIFTAGIPFQPLFIIFILSSIALAFTVISIGLHLSIALLTARFKPSTKAGLITCFVLIIIFTASASIAGSVWYHQVGHDGVVDAANTLIDDLNIRVEEGHNRVKIDIGPIHIDTTK